MIYLQSELPLGMQFYCGCWVNQVPCDCGRVDIETRIIGQCYMERCVFIFCIIPLIFLSFFLGLSVSSFLYFQPSFVITSSPCRPVTLGGRLGGMGINKDGRGQDH